MSANIHILIQHLGRGSYRAFNATGEEHEVLIDRCREPFFASARALLAKGHAPNSRLTMGRKDSPSRSDLRARLGTAAKLTVSEPANGSLRITRYQPFTKEHAACLEDA